MTTNQYYSLYNLGISQIKCQLIYDPIITEPSQCNLCKKIYIEREEMRFDDVPMGPLSKFGCGHLTCMWCISQYIFDNRKQVLCCHVCQEKVTNIITNNEFVDGCILDNLERAIRKDLIEQFPYSGVYDGEPHDPTDNVSDTP